MRPWITDTQRNPDGDWEFQVTFPDGTEMWVMLPAWIAGSIDPVDVAVAAKPKPPASVLASRRQITGEQGS